jgi:hypothetical protein
MRHGSIRSTVIGSVFRLRRFTLPTLCQDAGLERTQAYPILVELETQGYLTKSPVQQENRKPERPLNVYTLVDDPALKTRLMDEFAPSLRLAQVLENPPEPESLQRARSSLDSIAPELEALTTVPEKFIALKHKALKLDEVERTLNAVAEDLEIALFRMGLAQKEKLPPVIETELQRLESARTQLTGLRVRAEQALETRLKSEEAASQTFREAFTYVIASLGKAAVEACSPDRFSNYYPKDQKPAWFATAFEVAKSSTEHLAPRGFFSNLYNDLREKKHHQPHPLEAKLIDLCDRKFQDASSREWKHLLVAFKTDMTSAFREPAHADSPSLETLVLWTLVEFAIRYATDPDTAFWVTKSVEKQFPAYPDLASYNSLNFCFLAGNEKQARSSWQSLTEQDDHRFLRTASRTVYPGLLIATLPADQLKRELLDKMADVLGSSFACSIVAPQRVEAISRNPYVVESSAYNLLSASEHVPMSEGMKILGHKLYVYGPIENSLRRPGVPAITLATGLAGLGVPAVDAWEIAEQLRPGTALLVVNTSQDVQSSMLDHLNHFLGVLPPIEARRDARVGFVPADPSSTIHLVRRGDAVVYAVDRAGTMRGAFATSTIEERALTASADE